MSFRLLADVVDSPLHPCKKLKVMNVASLIRFIEIGFYLHFIYSTVCYFKAIILAGWFEVRSLSDCGVLLAPCRLAVSYGMWHMRQHLRHGATSNAHQHDARTTEHRAPKFKIVFQNVCSEVARRIDNNRWSQHNHSQISLRRPHAACRVIFQLRIEKSCCEVGSCFLYFFHPFPSTVTQHEQRRLHAR